MSNAAILLGAGKSTRMGELIDDKILLSILDKPVFAYSIEAFVKSKIVDTLVIIYKNIAQKNIIQQWLIDHGFHSFNILWAQGGKMRQDSVLSGLRTLSKKTHLVFIHDMARPLIQAEIIETIHRSLLSNKAATLARRVIDTIKQVFPEHPQKLNDLDRKTLWSTETPQAFDFSLLLKAYEFIEKQDLEVTDDAGAMNSLGHPIKIIENLHPNPKITIKSDIDYVEFLLTQKNYATI